MRVNTCPYCGSEHIRESTAVERLQFNVPYVCEECDFMFDEDDKEREEIRHKVSLLLDGTDEEHPLECYICVGEEEACGLSSLELPHVEYAFQVPGDGIMWFHIEGEYEDLDTKEFAWRDFDWFSLADIREILKGLEEIRNDNRN